MNGQPYPPHGRETTWLVLPESVILELVGQLCGEPARQFTVTVGGPQQVKISLSLPAALMPGIRHAFTPSEGRSPHMRLYYAEDRGRARAFCARFGVDLRTPFAGCYDPGSGSCLFLGDLSLGLLRSVLHGLACRAYLAGGYNPAHGALADLGAGAVLLAGTHGAGKSTTLIRLMARVPPDQRIAIWTDDWAVYRAEAGRIVGMPLDRRIELAPGLLGSPAMRALYVRERVPGTRSAYVDPARVFPWIGVAPFAYLRAVVLLGGHREGDWLREVPSTQAAGHLAAGAYHMPDDISSRGASADFWLGQLRNISCYAADTRRGEAVGQDVYGQLAALLGDGIAARRR
jgi:hypothetical protein